MSTAEEVVETKESVVSGFRGILVGVLKRAEGLPKWAKLALPAACIALVGAVVVAAQALDTGDPTESVEYKELLATRNAKVAELAELGRDVESGEKKLSELQAQLDDLETRKGDNERALSDIGGLK